MKVFLSVIVLFTIALGGAEKSYADSEAKQFYFTYMGSYINDDVDRAIDDGVGDHFGFGYSFNEYLNIEAFFEAADTDQEEHTSLGAELQWVFKRAERFSPYLVIGAGHFEIDPVDLGPTNDSAHYSYGAGFMFDIRSYNIALRAEVRQRTDTVGPEDLTDSLFSLGLQIPFGARKPKWLDGDKDGVLDGIDRCPNTQPGVQVDTYGCDPDSDSDGVPDSRDRCSGTPAGVSVDFDGCPLDSDGDGVMDINDTCPGTMAGTTVDEYGCAVITTVDTDRDGIIDRLDDCPNSAAGVQVDVKGCEIKEEITLRGVNFQSNSDRLVSGAESVLDDASATLKKNPSIGVEVAGHTDSDGAADHNLGLSARRATTVRDYLVASGISPDRMIVRGYGESQPIADNATSAGKATNRRVVLRILER